MLIDLFSDFSKAMMELIQDQTERDAEYDFRKFKPWTKKQYNPPVCKRD